MNEQLEDALADAVIAAELKTGYHFDFDTMFEVVKYSIQKMEAMGKKEEYLPLLLETELCDYVMREKINRRGEFNRVCNLLTKSLRQPVS